MIDTSKWNSFKIGDLFLIKKGKRLTKEVQVSGKTPYIGAVDSNNGLTNYIEQSPIHEGNTISLSYNGSVGEAFYQAHPFWATDDVNVLYPKFNLTRNIALFICPILRLEKYRFAYGRKWTLEKMNESIIRLPTKNGNPDWQFMEEYIEKIYNKFEKRTITKIKTKPDSLDISDWKQFKIKDLFDVSLSKGDLKLDSCVSGDIPLISSGETNNGCVGFIDSEGDGKAVIFKSNKITVDMFCNAFYQSTPFFAVSHGRVNILTPKFLMNKYIGLFIATLINKEKFRFTYGRAVYSNVISELTIALPTVSQGNPDWQFMENYIKSLPYSDLI